MEYLVDNINSENNPRVLDVGSGSGYLTACFAHLAGPNGKAVGIEHMKDLADKSIINIRKNHADMLDTGRIKIVTGDGRLGYPEAGPYDAIHVGAAASEMPKKLIEQLKVGGRMVIPVGRHSQEFIQIDRISEDKIEKKKLMDVIYVPLTSADEQLSCF